jgi:formyltetrahydrofolate synthetase
LFVCSLTSLPTSRPLPLPHSRPLPTFAPQPVVAINRFATDTDAEIALVKAAALEAGAVAAVEANHWAKGGAGAVDLARSVMEACALARAHAESSTSSFRFL